MQITNKTIILEKIIIFLVTLVRDENLRWQR